MYLFIITYNEGQPVISSIHWFVTKHPLNKNAISLTSEIMCSYMRVFTVSRLKHSFSLPDTNIFSRPYIADRYLIGGPLVKISKTSSDILLWSFCEIKNFLAVRGFDPRSSGLWAHHASTAPLCCWSIIAWNLTMHLAVFYWLLLRTFAPKSSHVQIFNFDCR